VRVAAAGDLAQLPGKRRPFRAVFAKTSALDAGEGALRF
jgi:hypothetical protein